MSEHYRFIPEEVKPPKEKEKGVSRVARRALQESKAFLTSQFLELTSNSKFDFEAVKNSVRAIAGPYSRAEEYYGETETKRRLGIIARAGPIVENALHQPENFTDAVDTICDITLESKITSEKLERNVPRIQYLRYITRDTSVLEPLLEVREEEGGKEKEVLPKIIEVAASTKISEAEKKNLIAFLFDHSTELFEKIKGTDGFYKYAEVVAEYGSEEQWSEIENLSQNKEELVAHLILSKLSKAHAKGDKMIEPMLYGLDKTKAINAWKQSAAKNIGYHNSFISGNLEAIKELSQLRPEAVKVLNEHFDIFDFARYPVRVLAAQYDQRDSNIPYGLATFPRFDHGGHVYKDKDQIGEFFDQLQGKLGLRIVETRGKLDMGRKLIGLDKKYGKNHKIEFTIIAAHGNKDVIGFGESKSQGAVRTEDIQKKNKTGEAQLRTLKDYFVSRPTVIIAACVTGEPEGIGQNLSELLDGEVLAPDKPCNVRSLGIDVSKERPAFFASFIGAETKRYISGVEVPYEAI